MKGGYPRERIVTVDGRRRDSRPVYPVLVPYLPEWNQRIRKWAHL